MKKEDVAQLESLCLRHAGVRLVGFGSGRSVVSPKEAWAYVSKMESKPSMVFSDDHLAQAQDEWWRLARSNRLFSSHNDCLFSISGLGQLPWAQILLPSQAPVFSIFARYEGTPEFLAMSESGEHLLAVTGEEDETWLYLVDCRGSQLRTIMPAPAVS